MSNIIGISSVSNNNQPIGIELLKIDLLNHFNTYKGELDWNPEYGSIIPSLLFETQNDSTKSQLYQEIQRILLSDPRVAEIKQLDIDSISKGYECECIITYAETMTSEKLYFKFVQ